MDGQRRRCSQLLSQCQIYKQLHHASVHGGVVMFHLVGRHRIMGAVSEETTLATTVLKVTFRSRPVHRSRQRQGVNSRVGRQRR